MTSYYALTSLLTTRRASTSLQYLLTTVQVLSFFYPWLKYNCTRVLKGWQGNKGKVEAQQAPSLYRNEGSRTVTRNTRGWTLAHNLLAH